MIAMARRAPFVAVLAALLFSACSSDTPTSPSDSTPTNPVAPIVGPEILSLSPDAAVAGSTVTVTVTGNHFVSGATTASINGEGVTVSDVSATTNSVTARVSIDAAAAPGPRTIAILTNRGGATATFTIVPAVPLPAPPSFSISPTA
jgi:hypothetical protein